MDVTKMWDYRVVRKESEDGSDEWYSIQEVYYDEGKPMAQTIDLQVEGHTVSEMKNQLKRMLKSLDEPVLDEIKFKTMTEIDGTSPVKGELSVSREELDVNVNIADAKD